MINIINEAIFFIMKGRINFDNAWPISTPIRLDKIRANAAAIKTIKGCPDSAVRINVAIWVLSPSSAINTAEKVVNTVFIKLDCIASLFWWFTSIWLDLISDGWY